MQLHKYEAIFFDLDDTLYDGTKPWFYSIEKTAEYLSKRYREIDFSDLDDVINNLRQSAKKSNPHSYAFAIRSLMFRDLLAHYGIDFRWGDIIEIEAQYWEYYFEGIEPVKGMVSLIKELSEEYKLFVITDFTFTDQLKRIDQLNLGDYFQDVITAQEVGELKKTGKIYRSALERHNLEPGNVLMVGDTVHSDIVPAKQLGIKTVLIPHPVFPLSEDEKAEADYLLNSVLEIRSIL